MAYLLKAKRNIEEQDIHEFKVKKEKYLERRKHKKELRAVAKGFEPRDFPAHIAPKVLQKYGDEKATVRYAEYVGSFSVPGTDQSVRTEFVRKQLNYVRNVIRTTPALVIISEQGIKVTDIKGQAEDINELIGDAFLSAHVSQESAPKSFNAQLTEKLEEQVQLFEEVQKLAEKEKKRNKKIKDLKGSVLPTELTINETESDRDKKYPWFRPKLAREEALAIIFKQPIGGFLVRESLSHPGSYTLSIRVDNSENMTGIVNYLLETTTTGIKFKGFEKEWSNLVALVKHHSIMPEILPCTLRMPDAAFAEATV